MKKQFTENWSEICQSMSKPLTDLAELNVNTLTNWSKNKGYLEELTQAKKPEDFLATQMKLANIAHLEAITYAKKTGDILMKAIEEWNERCNEAIHETSSKTADMMKTSHKSNE